MLPFLRCRMRFTIFCEVFMQAFVRKINAKLGFAASAINRNLLSICDLLALVLFSKFCASQSFSAHVRMIFVAGPIAWLPFVLFTGSLSICDNNRICSQTVDPLFCLANALVQTATALFERFSLFLSVLPGFAHFSVCVLATCPRLLLQPLRQHRPPLVVFTYQPFQATLSTSASVSTSSI